MLNRFLEPKTGAAPALARIVWSSSSPAVAEASRASTGCERGGAE